jgi:hypothetical protein
VMCVFIACFTVDATVKKIRDTFQERRLAQIKIGMSEAEAIRLIGDNTPRGTNTAYSITVWECESAFDHFGPGIFGLWSREGHTVEIASGKVVRTRFANMGILE